MADVTVKLTVGNVSIEVSGDSEYVNPKFEELVSRFLSSLRPGISSESSVSVSASREPGAKKTSPAEFLKQSIAGNQVDRALLLGYYLEQTQGVKSFTSTELGQLGKEAKQPFANPSDIVAKLTARGLMMSAGDKEGQRAYALTASGETYAESMLQPK
jgi:hypothetical protein